jgi:hypothetical protein
MQEIKVLVDEARIAEFYEMFGRWLAGKSVDREADAAIMTKPQLPWGNTDEDLSLAHYLWNKLTDRAQNLFGLLMDHPDERYTWDFIAKMAAIPNGRNGVAGVLAWPGRYCLQIGRKLPVSYQETDETTVYWMTAEIAELFDKARDADD